MRVYNAEVQKNGGGRFHGIGGGSLLKAEKGGEVSFLLCTKDQMPIDFLNYWTLVNIETGEQVEHPGIEFARLDTGTVRDLIAGLENLEKKQGYRFSLCGSKTDVIIYE